MQTRSLRNGLKLTELGLGASQFGNLYRETTDAESSAAVHAAWSAGVRYFDTAPHYGLGLSERRLGAALAQYPRDEYVLSTKVGRVLVPSPETADHLDDQGFLVPADLRREWDFSRDGIMRSVEDSLRRTGADRFDIVYLHDPDEHWQQASTSGIDALIELREQGVISAVGVGMNQSGMPMEFIKQCDIDVVMLANRFTLLEQGPLEDLLPLALERQVGIVAAAVYNSGLLSRPVVPTDARYDYAEAPRELIAKAQAIAAICEDHGASLPEAALQFPLRHPAVVSVVVGSRTAHHVVSNAARHAAQLPEQLWTSLEQEGLIRL